jgi:hypothetical protein
MTLSKGQIIGVVVATVAIAAGIGFLIWYIEKNKKLQTLGPKHPKPVTGNLALSAPPAVVGDAAAMAPASFVDPNANAYATRTPDLATTSGAHLYDASNPAPSDPQPVESDYAGGSGVGRQAAADDQWAPKEMMSQNDALAQANAENAQWFSANLLPNAELSCANDGMVTDGPTYEELAIFTPRLIEASIASRYFMDPPVVRKPCAGSDVLRPRPLISASAGSRENLVWGISSVQQSDLALQNAGSQSVFCLS